MTTLTNEQKLWLTGILPEHITITNSPREVYFWKDDKQIVNDREWHYIVSLVEGKLKQPQREDYGIELHNNVPEETCDLNPEEAFCQIAMLSLDKRTTVLQQVLTNEKEKK